MRDEEGRFLQEEQRIVHPANHVFYTWALVEGLTIKPTVVRLTPNTKPPTIKFDLISRKWKTVPLWHPPSYPTPTSLIPSLCVPSLQGQFEAEANRDDWRELIRPLDHIKLQVGPSPSLPSSPPPLP